MIPVVEEETIEPTVEPTASSESSPVETTIPAETELPENDDPVEPTTTPV